MDAYVEFNGVAAYFGQTDFAVVRKTLGAPVKAVGKLYLSSCHGVNYTSSSVWCQWGNMNPEISNLGMDAHRRIRRGGLSRAESQRIIDFATKERRALKRQQCTTSCSQMVAEKRLLEKT